MGAIVSTMPVLIQVRGALLSVNMQTLEHAIQLNLHWQSKYDMG